MFSSFWIVINVLFRRFHKLFTNFLFVRFRDAAMPGLYNFTLSHNSDRSSLAMVVGDLASCCLPQSFNFSVTLLICTTLLSNVSVTAGYVHTLS